MAVKDDETEPARAWHALLQHEEAEEAEHETSSVYSSGIESSERELNEYGVGVPARLNITKPRDCEQAALGDEVGLDTPKPATELYPGDVVPQPRDREGAEVF